MVTLSWSSAPAAAQSASTRQELWPELQLQHRLTQDTDALVLANRTRERQSRRTSELQFGFVVTHRLNEWFSFGVGYRYCFAPGGDPFEEHRLLAEQTLRFALPWDMRLSLRTREDLRWLNDGFSVRIRERTKIEREVAIDGYPFTPYVSAEIYYDTRFKAISRGRVILGSVFPVTDYLSLDIYAARQSDWTPRTKHVNALGMSVAISF